MPGDDSAWESDLFAVLDDLASLADAEFAEARRPDVADRAHAEYLHVSLASRLMANLGRTLTVQVESLGPIVGVLDRVATGWIALQSDSSRWIIRQSTLTAVRDVGRRSAPEATWPVTAKLRLPSPVRRLADDGIPCVFHHRDGSSTAGTPTRVGQDFIEIVADQGDRIDLVPIPALTAIQVRRR